MYQTSELVAQRIESYCRTWRLWIENAEGVISGDSIMSADQLHAGNPSLSDDIELGAVCSQSWNMTISDTETAFLGKEYDTYLYLVDYETNGILADEKIPMGRFTCVKSKKSGGSVQLTMADKLYFSDKPYVPHIPMPNWNKAVEDDICRQLVLQNGNDYTEVRLLRDKNGRRLIDKNGKVLYSKYFTSRSAQCPKT